MDRRVSSRFKVVSKSLTGTASFLPLMTSKYKLIQWHYTSPSVWIILFFQKQFPSTLKINPVSPRRLKKSLTEKSWFFFIGSALDKKEVNKKVKRGKTAKTTSPYGFFPFQGLPQWMTVFHFNLFYSLYLLLWQELPACPPSLHPYISSSAYLFASYLVAPSLAFSYQCIHCPSLHMSNPF